MTKRQLICKVIKAIGRLHYQLIFDGWEYIMDGKVHLALPNHPSYIDPLLIFAECDKEPFCPMADEKFFKRPFTRWFMQSVGAIEVPDLRLHRDRESVKNALSLTDIAVKALADGKSLVIYPSGHVAFGKKEEIGARRLAYETVSQLPEGVEILMVRTRGLETSHFSHSKKKTWVFRRKVFIHIEPMTEQLRAWAAEGDKMSFNKHLEDWYNADL